MKQDKEFEFTRQDFDYLRKLVTETSGIIAGEDKYTMFYSRLASRVRKLGLKNFSDYRKYLDAHRNSELDVLVNAVTTNLTSFFRENHHFDFIKNTILPEIKKTTRRRLRIWSAGCSTGEEAYSIAMTLAQSLPDWQNWDIKILATDLDSEVVSKAAAGVYDANRLKDVDKNLVDKYFKPSGEPSLGKFEVKPEIKKLMTFQKQNLLSHWSIHDKMDFIFCRNVVIYFEKPTKIKLIERFADHMNVDGYLFMGHSESLYKATESFKLLGKTVYQKV